VKFIHVKVSDELHEKIVHAAKTNGDTCEEWVRMACTESADYDIRRHRKRSEQWKAVKP
jgi:hypothetical protein